MTVVIVIGIVVPVLTCFLGYWKFHYKRKLSTVNKRTELMAMLNSYKTCFDELAKRQKEITLTCYQFLGQPAPDCAIPDMNESLVKVTKLIRSVKSAITLEELKPALVEIMEMIMKSFTQGVAQTELAYKLTRATNPTLTDAHAYIIAQKRKPT